ncbi:hypothetical protein N5F23_14995 [Pseudomonas sichuanensis]|uniref:hypothetical protein n=1 Tax=Pseudomonas TaxID=286 RepID=UPI00129B54A0|nr:MULTISPECIES: hypothetical protein [Pseudomonas]MDH0731850.1 hypothetical protein [Pseudomonas sichuanensis]MDH1583884.1 hypothetical protein [Pseudomonas sichuanensis]MDH1592442.1 hypothetical protein [Pseudomonas sichuanensis]MDH1598193.1 hypothetical protein [Pseudomonas sichuanensis]MDU9402712.1 hypothetical protein [Pseudomonas sp. zfem004]
MQKLLLPIAIFVSVIAVGKVCEHYAMDPTLKIGLLCVVAAVIQIAFSRYQRSRQRNSNT